MSEFFKLSERVKELSEKAEISAKDTFSGIDDILEYNTHKVLSAFSKNKVSEACFKGSTGYGYDDMGRDVLIPHGHSLEFVLKILRRELLPGVGSRNTGGF